MAKDDFHTSIRACANELDMGLGNIESLSFAADMLRETIERDVAAHIKDKGDFGFGHIRSALESLTTLWTFAYLERQKLQEQVNELHNLTGVRHG